MCIYDISYFNDASYSLFYRLDKVMNSRPYYLAGIAGVALCFIVLWYQGYDNNEFLVTDKRSKRCTSCDRVK